MRTRIAPLGIVLLAASALHAEPRDVSATEHWYTSMAAAPVDVQQLRDGLRRLVGLDGDGLLLDETNLPDPREIDEFDLSESSQEWLAATRATTRKPVDRYALLWDEEPAGSVFEVSDRTMHRRTDDDSVAPSNRNERSLESLVASDSLSTTSEIRRLVLAD